MKWAVIFLTTNEFLYSLPDDLGSSYADVSTNKGLSTEQIQGYEKAESFVIMMNTCRTDLLTKIT